MDRKKVLFVAVELKVNGAMKSLISLMKALPKDKYDVSLFLFKHGGELDEEIPAGVHVLPEFLPYLIFRIPVRKAFPYLLRLGEFKLAMFRLMISFRRVLKSNYFGMWKMLPDIPGQYDLACGYADGFIAPTVIKKTDAKRKVNWIHFPYSYCGQPKFVYQALLKSDLCIPVSKDTGKDLDKILKEKIRQHIVHNITDIEECKRLANEPVELPKVKNRVRIVSVGRVTSQKNFEIIPDIAKILMSRGLDFEWYIIGDGVLFKEVLSKTKDLHVENHVKLIGQRLNPMPWVKSADIIVIPSRFESWGMTVSEALCLGKVVITSNLPVFAEQITNGVNGLICNADALSMANAICKVIEDPGYREKLEQNAIKYPFTKESIIDEFSEIFTK